MAKIGGRVPLTAGVGGKVIGYVDIIQVDKLTLEGIVHISPEFAKLYGLYEPLGSYSIVE